jgi:hypothetical protein
MPYIVLRHIEYKGQQLEPGEVLPDIRPKRSLVTTHKIEWRPDGDEPEVEPIARSGDRSIPYRIPAKRKEKKKPSPVNVVPKPRPPPIDSLDDLLKNGVPLREAQFHIARQRVIAKLVVEMREPASEIEVLVSGMPMSEVYDLIEKAEPVHAKPEKIQGGKIDRDEVEVEVVIAKPEQLPKAPARDIALVVKPEPSVKEHIKIIQKRRKAKKK